MKQILFLLLVVTLILSLSESICPRSPNLPSSKFGYQRYYDNGYAAGRGLALKHKKEGFYPRPFRHEFCTVPSDLVSASEYAGVYRAGFWAGYKSVGEHDRLNLGSRKMVPYKPKQNNFVKEDYNESSFSERD